MNHPKTGDEELDEVELGEPDRLEPNAVDQFLAMQKGVCLRCEAHQSETELLRKRVEKLENALEYIQLIDEKGYCTNVARVALSGDKASESDK
jgi:hypothetical protein